MNNKTIEEKITLDDLYDIYEQYGVSTMLNDGKISGVEKEKDAECA